MAIHVERKDGTVAGFDDDKRDLAEKYAEDVNGTVTDISEQQAQPQQEQQNPGQQGNPNTEQPYD